MNEKIIRHGDVLLVPVTGEVTAGYTPVPRENGMIILAHGEATGHAHAVLERDAVLFDNGKGVRILAVETEADLRHVNADGSATGEHGDGAGTLVGRIKPIRLPKGLYRVIRQREARGGVVRRVAD